MTQVRLSILREAYKQNSSIKHDSFNHKITDKKMILIIYASKKLCILCVAVF